MNKHGLSDKVRSIARDRYVKAARHSGKNEFSIRVRDMLDALVPFGFPAGNTKQVCDALGSQKFTRENHLAIVKIDGPPSKKSTTVVVKYRFLPEDEGTNQVPSGSVSAASEDAKARAKRLTDGLRGLLREELAEYGGGEEFLKWVRSEDNAA